MCSLEYYATRRCVPRSPDVAANKYDRSTFDSFSLGPETLPLTPVMRDDESQFFKKMLYTI